MKDIEMKRKGREGVRERSCVRQPAAITAVIVSLGLFVSAHLLLALQQSSMP